MQMNTIRFGSQQTYFLGSQKVNLRVANISFISRSLGLGLERSRVSLSSTLSPHR